MPPDITPDALRELLNDVLDQRARIDQDTHRQHHAFVQQLIDKQRSRTEFYSALAQKSLPGIVLGLLGAAGAWIWHLIRSHVTWS